jgi:DNA-binding NtrC family response regulator
VTERRTETLATDGKSSGPARVLTVRVVSGPAKGTEKQLARATLVVGAGNEADLVVADKRVSRRHVELALVDDGVRVRDLGSKNGTRVNGVPVDVVVVPHDVTVAFGDSEIVFVSAIEAKDAGVDHDKGRRSFAGLHTDSAEMARLFDLLARAAASDVTLLLEGETGTGKDVLARAVHRESARADKPFLVVDCGSLAPSIVQSELFGHKKGAFTGATVDHAGVFESAAGGTVFLDEIGELPLELQPTLLRVLENKEVRRLGDAKPRAIDVRVLAATHRDLKARVADGAFRADLYFRLAVLRARVPPLRARREDIPSLAAVLLRDLRSAHVLSTTTLARLAAYDWPGNVRELRNTLASAVALSSAPDGPLEIGPLVADVDAAGPAAGAPNERALRDERKRNEREYLEQLLQRNAGNVSAAAREAGIDRKHLHKLIARHGLDASKHR